MRGAKFRFDFIFDLICSSLTLSKAGADWCNPAVRFVVLKWKKKSESPDGKPYDITRTYKRTTITCSTCSKTQSCLVRAFVFAEKVSSWDESEGGYQTNYTGPRSYLTAISEKLETPAETCLGKAKNDAGEARMDSE